MSESESDVYMYYEFNVGINPIKCNLYKFDTLSRLIPSEIIIECSETCFNMSLVGKTEILNVGEAVFMLTKKIDLDLYSYQLHQCIDNDLTLHIKNTQKKYQSQSFKLKICVKYSVYKEKIIFNNVYTSVDSDSLIQIYNDFKQYLNRCTRIKFTSNCIITKICFNSLYCDTNLNIPSYNYIANVDNEFILCKEFKNNILNYTLNVELTNEGKNTLFGILIYGI